MNREIKFRIWDKNAYTWWCEDSQYLQMDGKKIHPAPWSTLSCDLPNDNIIVQQFTGFKDVDGKDIYEGDIIQVLERNFSNFKGEVKWDDKWGGFKFCNHFPISWASSKWDKIIGNIFENPELITGITG